MLFIYTDVEGSVPLWEALKAKHESIFKLLMDNGADVGYLACIAVEKNDKKMLEDIVKFGGDVTLSTTNGRTALHVAVCEDNTEIVKFLLDQGANIDKQDDFGWTPRAYADHQCQEKIQYIFQQFGQNKMSHDVPPTLKNAGSFVAKCQSEPVIPGIPQASAPPNNPGVTWSGNNKHRRTASGFQNSFFGMMSAANRGKYAFIFRILFFYIQIY